MTAPRRAILAGLAGVLVSPLAGCGPALPSDIVGLAPSVALRLPDAGELGRGVEVAQMVHATHGGRDIAFEGQLSVTSERLLLACLDPMGQPVLTIRWSGREIHAQTTERFPSALRPENILADIILIYWPAAALRRGLRNAVLEDGPGYRIIRPAGEALIRIDYEDADPWNGTARYRNLAWNYTLEVRSVELPA